MQNSPFPHATSLAPCSCRDPVCKHSRVPPLPTSAGRVAGCPRLAPRLSGQCHGDSPRAALCFWSPCVRWGGWQQGWGARGSEARQRGPCGRALVPTETFPVQVSGPVLFFPGRAVAPGEGVPAVPARRDRAGSQGEPQLLENLHAFGHSTCPGTSHPLPQPELPWDAQSEGWAFGAHPWGGCGGCHLGEPCPLQRTHPHPCSTAVPVPTEGSEPSCCCRCCELRGARPELRGQACARRKRGSPGRGGEHGQPPLSRLRFPAGISRREKWVMRGGRREPGRRGRAAAASQDMIQQLQRSGLGGGGGRLPGRWEPTCPAGFRGLGPGAAPGSLPALPHAGLGGLSALPGGN